MKNKEWIICDFSQNAVKCKLKAEYNSPIYYNSYCKKHYNVVCDLFNNSWVKINKCD